jgi:ribosomal protein S18 acetylase RimI-like enzyme
MTADKITIRRVNEADLIAVGNILVDTWRSTFRGLLPDRFLDEMSPTHQSERVRHVMIRPTCACLVAVNPDDKIIGYACGGEGRGISPPAEYELYAIYIRDEHQRAGIGRQLFNAVSATLVHQATGSLFVWVLTVNPFRKFYERLGGQMSVTRNIDLGGVSFETIAYLWDAAQLGRTDFPP